MRRALLTFENKMLSEKTSLPSISDNFALFFTVLSVVLMSYVAYILVALYDKYLCSNTTFIKKTVLLVIAHPDDECMFFGPTLRNLVKADCWIYVICLTSGNQNKLGQLRKEELRKSCKILGIPSGNIIIIEHGSMPDKQYYVWSKVLVGDIVLKYVKSISATVVLSFDRYGISRHTNHISIYKGIRYLLEKGLLPKDCRVFALETTNMIRKYSSFFDVLVSYLAGENIFISSYFDVSTIQKAMREHQTQYVWFRKLYMLFSRYIYINSYRELY